MLSASDSAATATLTRRSWMKNLKGLNRTAILQPNLIRILRVVARQEIVHRLVLFALSDRRLVLVRSIVPSGKCTIVSKIPVEVELVVLARLQAIAKVCGLF
jgi:hypothetical protein